MSGAHDEVVQKAQDVVASYAASRGRSNPWSSLSTLLRQMQREYEDRFLYELVQNAYDAHPPDADGEIAILLAEDESDHGVLYVANRGNPFARENFDAICELAQSNKTPDESIGNKGVGFKSVLQVCEWPEIYSRTHADAPECDGYCFTFARLDWYDELAGGDKDLAEALREDVAPYFLPVPLTDPPASVLDFAERGFASVLRLPLKSAAAADVARSRVAKLESESVPLHLFLPHLQRCSPGSASSPSTRRTRSRVSTAETPSSRTSNSHASPPTIRCPTSSKRAAPFARWQAFRLDSSTTRL